jgi:hypothetical protein
MVILSTLVICAMTVAGGQQAPIIAPKITHDRAQELAQEALVALHATRKRDIEIWQNPSAPEFYSFAATRHTTAPIGPADITYLAVNPWTGDIWNWVTCERITSRSIRKRQRQIAQGLNLSDEALHELHGKSPSECSEQQPKPQGK